MFVYSFNSYFSWFSKYCLHDVIGHFRNHFSLGQRESTKYEIFVYEYRFSFIFHLELIILTNILLLDSLWKRDWTWKWSTLSFFRNKNLPRMLRLRFPKIFNLLESRDSSIPHYRVQCVLHGLREWSIFLLNRNKKSKIFFAICLNYLSTMVTDIYKFE